jgi:Glycosyl transferase family 2
MIAITVSTNYIDLLPFVYERNNGCFKHWVFVTDKNDQETINFLAKKPNVTVLYWDFQNERRHFDKGGAIRHAQYFVYDKFPNDWYLLIDADIVLPFEDQKKIKKFIINENENHSSESIYGMGNRFDFNKMSDLLAEINYNKFDNQNMVTGYFQLYKEKFFYSPSLDASLCDWYFTDFFSKQIFTDFKCYHLGQSGIHWKGKRKPGVDFLIDVNS